MQVQGHWLVDPKEKNKAGFCPKFTFRRLLDSELCPPSSHTHPTHSNSYAEALTPDMIVFGKMGLPDVVTGKGPTCQYRRHKRCGFSPWFGKNPWRRKLQPISVFLPGESHGGNCNPFQYSCLENPMDLGAGQATDRRVAKSRTQLKWHSCSSKFRWGHKGGALI